MTQPTKPDRPSEELAEQPLCPCGNPGHEPQRIGEAISSTEPDCGLYSCPESTRYGIGHAP
jgi:hypothetical protein